MRFDNVSMVRLERQLTKRTVQLIARNDVFSERQGSSARQGNMVR
jgi:hypothetical protein